MKTKRKKERKKYIIKNKSHQITSGHYHNYIRKDVIVFSFHVPPFSLSSSRFIGVQVSAATAGNSLCADSGDKKLQADRKLPVTKAPSNVLRHKMAKWTTCGTKGWNAPCPLSFSLSLILPHCRSKRSPRLLLFSATLSLSLNPFGTASSLYLTFCCLPRLFVSLDSIFKLLFSQTDWLIPQNLVNISLISALPFPAPVKRAASLT